MLNPDMEVMKLMNLSPDDLAAGFVVAARDIAPMMQGMEAAALVSSFVMLGDVLTAFGLTEAHLVALARQSARLRLVSPPVLH